MTKPKTPIYPRPVSPLNAEPLRAQPEDIYLDDSSDSYSDSEQRATKRRRIERLGEGYLRGDGLFIMTASLKGPWMGWVNPWSKQNGKAIEPRAGTLREDAKEEVPRNTLRISRRGKNRTPITSADRDIPRAPSLPGHVNKRMLESGKSWLKTVYDDNGHVNSERDDSPTPVRKHDYVRSPNHRSSTEKVPLSQSRPQPASACSGIPTAILKQPPEDKRLEPIPTLSSNTRQDSKPKTAQPPQSGVPAALSRNGIPTAQSDRYSVAHGDQQITKLATLNGTLHFEFESKRGSIHELPPLTHPPEFECRPVADSLKSVEKPKEEHTRSCRSPGGMKKPRNIDFASSTEMPIAPYRSPANDGADSQKQAGRSTLQCEASTLKGSTDVVSLEKPVENCSVNPQKMLQPSTSTQTSTTTTTNMMPSAQIVPTVQAPSAESYYSIASKMIEHETTPTANNVSAHNSTPTKSSLPNGNEQQESLATILGNLKKPATDGTIPNRTKNIQSARSQLGIVPFSTFKSSLAPSAFSEPDTQEMLAAITPLGFSIVQKGPLESVNKSTPATTTRMNPQKGKKRASFAPVLDGMPSGSSQGSIKGSLKVSKMVDKPAEAGKSLARLIQPPLFGELGLDMETSDEEGGTGEAGSLPGLASLLRGEPHPQVAPISSGHLGTANTAISTSSAQQQDAQQQHGGCWDDGQTGNERQDDFNLATAIDDLGSFLGTWDANKEAKEIESGMSNSCVGSALKSRDSMSGIRGR
jgi:hypothetical protein